MLVKNTKKRIKIKDFNLTEKKFLILFSISKLYFISSIIILYLLSKGFSFIEIAILDATFWGAIFAFEIPTGWIADRYGRKISLFLSYSLQAFSLFVLFLEKSFYILILSFLVWGISTTLRSGAEQAWIYDQITIETFKENKPKECVDYRFHGVFGLLMATGLIAKGIGDFVGGLLASLNLSLPILFTAVTSLIAAFFLLIIPEQRPERIKNEEKKNKRLLKQAVKELTTKQAVLLFFTLILIVSINSSLLTWSQAFFKESLGLEMIYIGAIYGLTTFVSAWGNSKSQVMNNKWGEKTYLILPFIVGIFFLLIGLKFKLISIVLFIAGAFFAGALNPFLITKINGYLSSETRATALSILSSITTIGVIIIEILTAYIINNFSFFWYFAFISVSYIGIIGPLLILWRTKDAKYYEKRVNTQYREENEQEELTLERSQKEEIVVSSA